MKMLAVNTKKLGWQWVARRDPKLQSLVTTPVKSHSLGTEDLEYFRTEFPEIEFVGREVLCD